MTSRFVDDVRQSRLAEQPVVQAFRDAPDGGRAELVGLATYGQVGTVYGLSFDPARRRLYAAAFLRRGSLFSSAGPGAIFSLDLPDLDLRLLTALTAGSGTVHQLSSEDRTVVPWIGRMSLGDIDVDPAGADLFAANLFDGRIHRLALPDGTSRGSFAHGATGRPWAEDSRPFGLAVRGDRVYHGVVDPIGASLGITTAVGHIYSSAFDGADMREVAAFALDPPLADRTVVPWLGGDRPVVSDIDFRPDGSMVVGIRNLTLDAVIDGFPPRLGDLLPAEADAAGWRVEVFPERFDDALGGRDESLTGGIALLPGLDLAVATGPFGDSSGDGTDLGASAAWFDGATGDLARVARLDWWSEPAYLPGTGDVEALCAPDTTLDPSLVATATADIAGRATGTAAAVATRSAALATAAGATMTAAVPTVAAYAPTWAALATRAARSTVSPVRATAAADAQARVHASCGSGDPYYAVAHVGRVRRNTPEAADTGLSAFDRSGHSIALADENEVGAVYGLAVDSLRGHIYAGAFERPDRKVGSTGTIHRLEPATGRVTAWALLPTGRATRGTRYPESGVGDVEVDEAASQLFAVNLADRLIYRLSLPGGQLLGLFGHGAGAEPWAAQAWPFALGFHDGWLFHAVVPDMSRAVHRREAIVYRSRPDGTEMSEVLRFDLDYRVAGQSLWHSSAFVSDLAFRPGGAAIVALRDGTYAPRGDLLPAVRLPSGWAVAIEPEHYQDRTSIDEAVCGGLAAVPGRDLVVAVGSGMQGRQENAGALWFENGSGALLDQCLLVRGRGLQKCDPERHDAQRKCYLLSDYEILGDLEPLCAAATAAPTPTETVTATPTATRTTTATPTRTASEAASPTATRAASATPTMRPRPLYLPLALDESCHERKVHADVVLVVDVSTSMTRPTADGRPKMEAVQDAARAFIDLLDFDPAGGHDQVAVAAFNDRAWVAASLGADAGAARAGVDRLPESMAQGTRLDLAIEIGLTALQAPSRTTGNTRAVVLLTDGLPNRVPPGPGGTAEETVLAAAERARAAGIQLYTVGVGRPDAPDVSDRINADLLRAVASRPSMFFQTVDASELSRIYAGIAYTLGCPPESWWARRSR